MLPPEVAPAEEVAREVGIGLSTLQRWHSEALAQSPGKKLWTAAARFDAVLVTAVLDEAGKAAWCRANGVYLKDCRAGARAPRKPWRPRARRVPARTRLDRIGAASRISNATCGARTPRWPRRQRCWRCQKARGDLPRGRGQMIVLDDRHKPVSEAGGQVLPFEWGQKARPDPILFVYAKSDRSAKRCLGDSGIGLRSSGDKSGFVLGRLARL
jgi:transposase